jgi:hypothetical protein
MHVNAGFLATALAAAALASAAAIAGDSPVRTDYDRIANEGTIGDKWMLVPGTTLPAPAYPAHLAATGGTACIALGYLIGSDGKPSEFAVLKQWSSLGEDAEPMDGYWKAFAQAGADAVSQWRFQPKPGATAVPTYTVATLGFAAGKGADSSAAGEHCRIAQLRDHLARMQADYQQSNIVRQQLENERRRQREMHMDDAVRRVNARPRGG